MPITLEAMAKPVLVGRSSSVFTRVARIFALELGVDHTFRVVPDLLASEAERYGGNPALKLPTLLASSGSWFGALTICRELARLTRRAPRLVWPEHLTEPLLANAQELTLQAMATEVALIMARQGTPESATNAPEHPYQQKLRQSLLNSLDWLEEHVSEFAARLPESRDLSYLEVTLFCLVTHLEFREVMPVAGYAGLAEFRSCFGARSSAVATAYRYDA